MESNIKLNNLPKQPIFKIPEGYFDLLLPKIYARLHRSKPYLLQDIKPLSEYSVIEDMRGSVFTTPPDYFENLYNSIVTKLDRHSESIKLDFEAMRDFESESKDDREYTIPDNYFEHLSDRILARVDLTEKREPLDFSALEDSEMEILAEIPKKNIFEVPENYFERLTVIPEINETSKNSIEEQETKVIRLIPGWARYATAIAASVVLLLNAGYWFYPKETQSECTELLCNLSDEEILHYLEKQDVRLSGAQVSNAGSTHLDGNILEQSELSDDELLNAIEGVE